MPGEDGFFVCCKPAYAILRICWREIAFAARKRTALFNRVSRVFESTTELTIILTTVLEEVRRLLEVTACSIWLCDSETGELVCEHAIEPFVILFEVGDYPRGKELLGGWQAQAAV